MTARPMFVTLSSTTPAGTEAMSEEELAKLVTVDSLIGAGYALEASQQKEAEKLSRTAEAPRVRPD